ncbi:MAG TPA: Hsp20/alpha crystallin family protein [Candidatus Limnocylindrales bacterium]|jgi:HSP20 family protein|nr:Hsp20/alpha crystallin family protein [Candidatus Limnocylindrales bacterium]
MTMITRIDPFRELATLQDRFNSLFENFAEGNGKEQLAAGHFVPPVDVYEDEQNLVLKLEVPGMNEEDLKVSVENNTLTVSGERKFEKEEKEENFHRIERRYGSFTRTFRLPNTVDQDKADASYDKGILKITLGKRAEAKPKQIKVGSSQKTLQG